MHSFDKTIVRRAAAGSAADLPQDLHPVVRRVYANRNLSDPAELDRELAGLLPVSLLGGTREAASLLQEVIAGQGSILVLADFDADGATSCALMVRGLTAMGAKRVGYLVPNRFEYGYGLTPEIGLVALERGPDLLITVDNGISSLEGIAALRAAGVRVLVTDHHLPGDRLPDADVIVNPNRPDEAFPSGNLAGVGVAFYVLAALRQQLRESGWFAARGLQEPNLADLLDLVALGTVADVVPLDHNNRILVHQGLRRIRSGRCCEGVKALVRVAGRALPGLVASDLGYAVGPRLNAAGRLEDMSLGIECPLTDDPLTAADLAGRLHQLNLERRGIEQEMQQQALTELDDLIPQGELPFGICLFRPEWHQGVIGILAARIRERLHRPVICFAAGEEPGMIKGSARSVPGLHIRDTLDAVAARHPGLLRKFGGHAMAAGLSLARASLEPFAAAFDQAVRGRIGEESLRGVIHSDGPLQGEELSMRLAELLRDAGPWGQGFPEPLFDGLFRIVQRRVVAQRHLKMVLEPGEGGGLLDAIAFNQAADSAQEAALIHAAYRLEVNEFRGNRGLQLVVEHFEAVNS